MATEVTTSLGTILSISAGVPATQDAAGYAALTYTVVGEVTSVGEYGANFQEVTHTPLNTGVTQKFKGAKDNGSAQLSIGRDPDDAGQALLRTAAASRNAKYAFRVQIGDAAVGGTQYFQARVMSYTTNVNDANSVTGATATLGITTDVVEVN